VLLVYPTRLPLWPVRFALRWLLQQQLLPLQQLLSLQRPIRPLCRLLWFRCSLLLWSLRWLRLLPLLRPSLPLQR
jgi:hypothetical protein